LFTPENPLAPPKPVFDEPWQAQALALADSMVQAGHFTAQEWAEALGGALKAAAAKGKPDTLETYYTSVVTALEQLSETHAGISAEERRHRRHAWEHAYERTPHGKPVVLPNYHLHITA
jgi:nitrile hydratase accessory protein